MTPTKSGWILFIAALGMMCSLLAHDVSNLQTWNEFWTPSFIGVILAHIGAVITAFIGGRIIPSSADK